MTAEEAAERVGKDVRTIREWARKGDLPVLATLRRNGRPVRYFDEVAVLEADRLKTRGRPAGKPRHHESAGVALIDAERTRHVFEEGYTPDGDRGRAGELAAAAASYAYARGYALLFPDSAGGRQYLDSVPAGMWPWAWDLYKPTEDAVADLVKAGALIASAIDALLEERS